MAFDLDKLIGESKQIFSLPQIFNRINEVVNDPEKSFEDVADVIRQDLGLSTRLLQIANSSFYHFPEKIETVTHAVCVVGTQQLRDLALGAIVVNTFKGIPENLIAMKPFWQHSIASGIAARTLAVYLRDENPERLYITGMLHEVGRLILFTSFQDQANRALRQCRADKELLLNLEKEMIGCDHAAAGGALLEAWEFPAFQVEAVRFHHTPTQAAAFPIETTIVHVADIIAHTLHLGSGGEFYIPTLQLSMWENLNLSADLLQPLCKQVEKQFAEINEIFLGD